MSARSFVVTLDDPQGSVGHYNHYPHDHHDSYYPYHHEPDHHVVHHDHHSHDFNSLLLPLAGVVLLGAAAVFASANPILLQLGVISGRRRRRELGEEEGNDKIFNKKRLRDVLLLEKFISQLPREEVERQERQLLATYLSCSAGASGSVCVERLACELHSPVHNQHTGQQVIDMVISEIITNEFIDENLKKTIMKARRVGHLGGDCTTFYCSQLDNTTSFPKENYSEG